MTSRLAFTRSAASTSSSDASLPRTSCSISKTTPASCRRARTSSIAGSDANLLSVSESPRELLTMCRGSSRRWASVIAADRAASPSGVGTKPTTMVMGAASRTARTSSAFRC